MSVGSGQHSSCFLANQAIQNNFIGQGEDMTKDSKGATTMKNRKDAWSPDDDRILTETVLEYENNGDTKTSAYKKAAELLDRTASACRYRWNNVIKKAEVEREDSTVLNNMEEQPAPQDRLEMNQVIDYLRNLKKQPSGDPGFQENQQLLLQNKELTEKSKALAKTLEEKQNDYEKIAGKYQTLLEMMQEAEKLLGNNRDGGFVH